MAKHNEIFGLLGEYQVLCHQDPVKAEERALEGQYEFVTECNAIERNSLKLDDVKRIISEGVSSTTKDNREELETVGLNDACNFVRKLIQDGKELSEEVIKEIHSVLYVGASADFRGQYRSDFITIPHAQNLPPVRHISYYMNKLFDEYAEMMNKDVIEKIAIFHIKFESIHPFPDGNGQVGRLIMNYQLVRAGFPPIAIPVSKKKDYIHAIEKYNMELNIEPMKDIITDAIVDQLKKSIEAFK